jgi:NTP pyrophosphatase (non-canonical NTP hydrolase)
MDLEKIQKLSLEEKKNLLERTIKLQEETGELAEQVLIAHQSSGSQYKRASKDAIKKEAADIILVALSIFFLEGGTPKEFEKILKTKATKWKKFIKK